MSKDLEGRIDALERRVRDLEQGGAAVETAVDGDAFWALAGLKARAPQGGVLYTGYVPLPTGEVYEWQGGLPTDQLLDTDWSELAPDLTATLDALSHPVRLLILQLVLTGTTSVAELQQNESLGTSGQLYHHLRQLVAAGWLRSSSRGQYAVPPDRIVPLLAILTAARR
jgi:DNA-binding transcriptional ArsR family regulator